nr:AraC family transcriptional regulator [Elizabethkingia sp. ASV34]
MKIILSFFLCLIFIICKSQIKNLSETEIIDKFDKIVLHNSKADDLGEIKKLYQYSVDNHYKLGILKGLTFLQQYFVVNGDYLTSLDYCKKALESGRQLNDNNALSNIYMYEGTAFAMMDMYIESKKSLETALKYTQKIDNIIDRNIQLSKVYTTLAGMSEGSESNDSILYYAKNALEALEAISNQNFSRQKEGGYYEMLISQYLNMGSIYSHFIQPPDLEKAESYYSKALTLSKSHPQYFKSNALFAHFTIGHFYYQKKEYPKSIKYLEMALEEEKVDKDPTRRLAIYDNLRNIYDSIKDVSQQNQYLKLYSKLSDSLNGTKNKAIVSQLDERTFKSKQELNSFRTYFIWSGVLVSLFVILMGIYFYRRNRTLKANYTTFIQKLELEVMDGIEKNGKESNSTGERNYNISSDKEDSLMKKILVFESSEKFLKKGITLSYLSFNFNTNPRYLSLIINKNKNKNFNDYINELRIRYITDKLYRNPLYREYKISYLAEECGYASHQVFINAFRKETGMTPSYFINNLKNLSQDNENIS